MWMDGSSYKGHWKDNEFEGHGEYSWGDGRVYIGMWKLSRMHGQGEL